MSDALKILWGNYLTSLNQKPIRTKALTSGTIAAISEILAQRLAGTNKAHLKRIILMAFLGLVYNGPSAHFVHTIMDKIFKRKHDIVTVAKKVIVEQLIYGPLCNVVFIAYVARIVEGKPWSYLKRKLKADYWTVQKNAWKLWPLVSLINYKFVPFHLRVLFVNIVALFWTTFLNLKARSSKLIKDI